MYDSAATTIAGISSGPDLTAAAAAAAAPVSGAGTPGANNAGTTTAGVTTAAAIATPPTVTAPGTHNIGTVTAGVTTAAAATAPTPAAIAAAGSGVCAPDVAHATHIDNPATPPVTPAASRWKPPRKRPIADLLEYPNDLLEFPSSDPLKRRAWEQNMREGNKRVAEGLRYLGLAHGRVTFGPGHAPIHRLHPFPGRAPTRGIDRVMGDSYRHSPHLVFRPNFQGGGVSEGVSTSDGVGERAPLDKAGHSDEVVSSGDESSGDEWLLEFDDYWNSEEYSPRNAGQ
jgi:hypothetical protein